MGYDTDGGVEEESAGVCPAEHLADGALVQELVAQEPAENPSPVGLRRVSMIPRTGSKAATGGLLSIPPAEHDRVPNLLHREVVAASSSLQPGPMESIEDYR